MFKVLVDKTSEYTNTNKVFNVSLEIDEDNGYGTVFRKASNVSNKKAKAIAEHISSLYGAEIVES